MHRASALGTAFYMDGADCGRILRIIASSGWGGGIFGVVFLGLHGIFTPGGFVFAFMIPLCILEETY